MRHSAASRRGRGRGNSNRRGGNQRTQVFDSNGPDVRIRGTAHQVCEKYQALATDALASDNRVLAESYLQHAEHYQRIINGWQETIQNRKKEEAQQTPADAVGTTVGKSDDLGLPESLVGTKKEAPKSKAKSKEELESA